MNLLVTFLLGLASFQYITQLEVVPMEVDGGAFRESFNASADRPRLVALFSPT